MSDQVKTFVFASDAESWSFTTGGKSTGAFTSGDGNPSGSLETDSIGRNNTDSSTWTWTGTFEDLGVPSGATINGYSASSFDHKCSVANILNSAQFGDIGNTKSLEINDGTARDLIGIQTFSGITSWANKSNAPAITGLSLASTTSITLTLHTTIDVGNNAAAQCTILADNISLTINYTDSGGFVPAFAKNNNSLIGGI